MDHSVFAIEAYWELIILSKLLLSPYQLSYTVKLDSFVFHVNASFYY